MDGLTAASLFTGIGGFDEALRRAGVAVKAAVEIDEGCRSTLRRYFPETRLFNDVAEVTGGQLRAAGFVPERGILCGGWPCQDLSVAGRRAGLGGARSGLFWEVVRLAGELRPRWLLLENVPGLLSAVCPCPGDDSCTSAGRALRCGRWQKRAGKRVFIPNVQHTPKGGLCPGGCMGRHGGAMGTVVGALERLGYGLCWRVLDAQYFGVPQRRDRVFFAGCLGDGAAPVEVLLEPESCGRDHAAGAKAGPRVAGTLAASAGSGGLGGVGQSGNSISSRLDEATASALQGGGRRGYRVDAEGAAGGQLIAVPVHPGRELRKDQNGIGIGSPGDPSYTLDATGAQSVIAFDCAQITSGENRVNPKPGDPQPPLAATGQPMVAFPVALRGREDGSQAEMAAHGEPAFAVRGNGGGSSYGMVATLGGEGVRNAPTSEGADASEDGTGRGTPLIAYALTSRNDRNDREETYVTEPMAFNPQTGGSAARLGYADKPTALQANQVTGVQTTTGVRRLTPLECERLQGFPDYWTLRDADGNEQSDSARYRRLGNAVAIPVVEWITRRIVAVEASLVAAKGDAA